MNIVFLHEGITQSLIPLLTIAEHHPDCIVGCILVPTKKADKEQLPKWFFDADDTASSLLNCVNEGKASGSMNAFLIIREPNSFLQFNVLAAIDCFNFNSSGEGGKGGKKFLEILAKHNIRISLYKSGLPLNSYSSKSLHERNEQIKAAFENIYEDIFGKIAYQWLPESWGLEPVSYY
jgi:hypothetical protein